MAMTGSRTLRAVQKTSNRESTVARRRPGTVLSWVGPDHDERIPPEDLVLELRDIPFERWARDSARYWQDVAVRVRELDLEATKTEELLKKAYSAVTKGQTDRAERLFDKALIHLSENEAADNLYALVLAAMVSSRLSSKRGGKDVVKRAAKELRREGLTSIATMLGTYRKDAVTKGPTWAKDWGHYMLAVVGVKCGRVLDAIKEVGQATEADRRTRD